MMLARWGLMACAALLYLGCGLSIVRKMSEPDAQAPAALRWVASAAFGVHALALACEIFSDAGIGFGSGLSLSIILWLAAGVMIAQSGMRRITALMGVVLMIAAAGVVAPGVFPAPAAAVRWTPLLRALVAFAMLAYSLLLIAVVQAVFLTLMERQLRRSRTAGGCSRTCRASSPWSASSSGSSPAASPASRRC